jgi:hypothetical protein
MYMFYILYMCIQSEATNDNSTPLVVFVNSKSGGQFGAQLIHDFERLLDKHQVFDITADGGPERG